MSMTTRAGLSIDTDLAHFIETSVLPGTGLGVDAFWAGAAGIFTRFTPRNQALLARRDELQARIDAWYRTDAGKQADGAQTADFLRSIGYLVPEPAPFAVDPVNVDPELAFTAGPQLVVPVLNARFALNAANARWGSLYDALYGTDALPGKAAGKGYDAVRGTHVVAWAKRFLDEAAPLSTGTWDAWTGGDLPLANPAQLVGRKGANILLRHNGLHIEVVIDPAHPIGATDPAGIADVILEAAITTICDFEDSIAAVDGQDKLAAYANWLGLMDGSLADTFEKNGKTVTRSLNADRTYTAPDGTEFTLSGRSLLLVRNVGHLMTTPAIRLADGSEAFEGIMDGIVTSAIALHDLKKQDQGRNSRTGSIYIVKPKMHGPEEAAFADDLFDAIEDLLALPRHTIKIGVMDEERRTSANLAATIHAVRHRIMFINTGFLDRTGDEIHTAMQAGPMLRKGEIKGTPWIAAYEQRNVQIGLACGLSGKAQIGKGMWAMPDRMADMLIAKIAHPQTGANTAWVPSPTAAVLHATHYHDVDVFARQAERRNEAPAPIEDLLTIPLARDPRWSAEEIAQELDNNAQGILGYVVRWVDQGVGCSKVPDISDIGLMEDRATLRISSQHIANWLLHGIVTADQVEEALQRMAGKVDAQNAGDPAYQTMAGNTQSLALQAARALVFEGTAQPSGYTEPLLHAFRARVKAQATAPQPAMA